MLTAYFWWCNQQKIQEWFLSSTSTSHCSCIPLLSSLLVKILGNIGDTTKLWNILVLVIIVIAGFPTESHHFLTRLWSYYSQDNFSNFLFTFHQFYEGNQLKCWSCWSYIIYVMLISYVNYNIINNWIIIAVCSSSARGQVVFVLLIYLVFVVSRPTDW